MVKIQYISDLHLEHHKNNNVFSRIKKLPDCENICVLGDVGYPHSQIYKDFMIYCSNNWKNVFWIIGNHEFYHKRKTDIKIISEIEEYIKQIVPKNVYFMNNTVLFLNQITNEVKNYYSNEENVIKIIGCTLWSNINDYSSNYINDYRLIYIEKVRNEFNIDMFRTLKPETTKKFFQDSKKFILNEINTNIKCLILTHHGTHDLCNGNYIGSPLETAYATYIPEIYESKNVIASICGHIHSNVNVEINGIKLLSNCMGYIGEKQSIVKYNPNAILKIEL